MGEGIGVMGRVLRWGLGLAAPLLVSGCFVPCCMPPPPAPGPPAEPFAIEEPVVLGADFDDSLHSLLQAAAEGRDGDMRRYIAPDITVSFGTSSGRAAFFEIWKDPDAPEPWGRFLDTLDAVVGEGAAASQGGRVLEFPHYAHITDPDVDPYRLAWIDEGAVVRRKPSARAEQINTGGTRAVECAVLLCRDQHEGWTAVRVATGGFGYVQSGMIRPVLAQYRAVFEKRGGRWVLTVLVQGD